ncbi:MAG: UDP-3-O-acyl-N-acetylglucosamine deacetylase [Planctomycetaceae bacterium]|jgi:UDP-3-O-acyl N-acetylglucosamine deacetylase|nr:UDP-3-O-acyl-N-acetylglucosamine deacetylase [Planctomycetaceae bacterium]
MRQTFRLQNTLAGSAVIEGFGFWTGEDVRLEFRPAQADSGVVFVRSDLPGNPRIPALIEYRGEKPRQTSLVNGAARVDMIEHLLAAVKALKIDNCEIWTDRPEMPGFDGSSRPFIQVLAQIGTAMQPAVRHIRLVTQAFQVDNGQQRITVSPSKTGRNLYRYSLIPGSGYSIEPQEYTFDLTPEGFSSGIAACRTFLSKGEADYLLEKGLCQRVTPKDVIVLGEHGPIENEFRFNDECARHKILDMVGDFSLCNCDWVGEFSSSRGGHSINAECVRQLLDKTMLLDETFLSRRSNLMLQREEMLKAA